jgi:hypothetical protein
MSTPRLNKGLRSLLVQFISGKWRCQASIFQRLAKKAVLDLTVWRNYIDLNFLAVMTRVEKIHALLMVIFD